MESDAAVVGRVRQAGPAGGVVGFGDPRERSAAAVPHPREAGGRTHPAAVAGRRLTAWRAVQLHGAQRTVLHVEQLVDRALAALHLTYRDGCVARSHRCPGLAAVHGGRVASVLHPANDRGRRFGLAAEAVAVARLTRHADLDGRLEGDAGESSHGQQDRGHRHAASHTVSRATVRQCATS